MRLIVASRLLRFAWWSGHQPTVREALAECRRRSNHPVAVRLGAFVYRPSLLAPYEDVVPPDPESLVHACDPDTDFVAPRILRWRPADGAA